MYTKEYYLSFIKELENNNSLLNKKKWIMNNKTYEIYKYNKISLTSEQVNSLGLCRSIIFYNDKISAIFKKFKLRSSLLLHSLCKSVQKLQVPYISLFLLTKPF